MADIRQIQTALELGFSETSEYPTEATAVTLGDAVTDDTTVLCNNGGNAVWQDSTTGCTTVFMGLVPSNPTPNGAAYSYTSATGATYSITFTLEGATGQLPFGANCANPSGITGGSTC